MWLFAAQAPARHANAGGGAAAAATRHTLLFLVLCTLLLILCAGTPLHEGSRRPFFFVYPVMAAATGTAQSPIVETELLAIDLGHENMKISAWRVQEEVVQTTPGTTAAAITGAVSMVLNDQTNRKSPPCVAFRYFKAPAGSVMNEERTDKGQKEELEWNRLYPHGYQLERSFAEQAQALAPRFPTQVVCSPAQLLGYTLANTTSKDTAPSPYERTEDELSAAYSFRVRSLHNSNHPHAQQRRALGVFVPFFTNATADSTDEGSFFTSEELTAMLFGYARRMAEKADAADNVLSEDDERQLEDLINKSIMSTTTVGLSESRKEAESLLRLRGHAVPRYAALTIPIHATVAQRQALVDAAALAGLRVVRLVHSTTGAAVQLAYMKAEQVFVQDKTQYVMVYDMGSQQTEVAIYSYTAAPTTVARRVKYEGTVELKSLVGSQTLGGAAFDECIAAQWDALYFGNSIRSAVGRATSEAARQTAAKQRDSLLRAAHKAKETLSVNQEVHVALDGVHADPEYFNTAAQKQLQQHVASITTDGLLSLRYTRREFERACTNLFDAAVTLRDAAIASSNGFVANVRALDRFEVIGGGTRVPLLLQKLSEGYRGGGRGLVDRTLNSDEAAVLGTTLLSVSSASHALKLRGTQSVPKYQLREWLTSTVYLSITPNNSPIEDQTGGEAKAYLRLLFPAHTTVTPATRSVRVQLRTDDVEHKEEKKEPKGEERGEIKARGGDVSTNSAAVVGDSVRVTLYAGAAVDAVYQARARAAAAAAEAAEKSSTAMSPTTDGVVIVPASAAACASCYVRAYVLHGITKAKESLKTEVQRAHLGDKVVLDSAEVVVETVVTVSGIPHCTVAYLRAVYRISPASSATTATTALETADTTSSPRQTDAEALNEKESTKAAEDTEETEGEEGEAGTPPPPPTTPTDAQTTSAVFEVKVVALPLRDLVSSSSSSSSLQRYNMARAERQHSRERVRRLQAMDDTRLQRSTLRNDIEGVIVWLKEQPAWEEDTATPGDAETSWRVKVKEIGEWLDNDGETAGVAALEERLVTIRTIKQALRTEQRN